MPAIRRFNLILFILCSFFLLVAYYLQFMQNAPPCSLCVIQRLALTGLAANFLLCAIHNPKHRSLWIYAILNAFILILGLMAAGRQLWLQNQLLGNSNICVPNLPSIMSDFSIFNVLNNLGAHQCAELGPYFLEVSLPLWTFLFFSLLIVLVLIMPVFFAIKSKRVAVKS